MELTKKKKNAQELQRSNIKNSKTSSFFKLLNNTS